MKKYMIIAMATALFASCSDSDEERNTSPAQEPPVEIKVNAGVGGLHTRTPLTMEAVLLPAS